MELTEQDSKVQRKNRRDNLRYPLCRVSPRFFKELQEAGITRVKKGLANPFKINMREMTELATRTQSWKTLIDELNTKPKRRDDII